MSLLLALTLACTNLLSLQAYAAPKPCAAEQGARRAADYLRQCRDVASPGERLACSPSLSCTSLVESISRGCEALGADGPDFCGLYASEGEADADPDTVD